MAIHWVNYDLNKTGQNYDGLITYLKSHDTWCKPLKSSFLVVTSLSVAQLRDGILKHIDTNDDVLVINVDGKPGAWYGLPDDVSNWLLKHL
jgi:hypothetical protein